MNKSLMVAMAKIVKQLEAIRGEAHHQQLLLETLSHEIRVVMGGPSSMQ